MFKPISTLVHASVGSAGTEPKKAAAQVLAQSVFRVLHGYYGVLFLSKFSTGELNENKLDAGVISARRVWANSLEKFDLPVVTTALEVCKKAHPEYPPSLPQFLALCEAAKPRETYKPDIPALPMGQAIRSQYAARSREIVARHELRAIHTKSGFVDLPVGLDGLKQAVAMAVGLAGGDETATLLRLDRQFSPRVAP